MSARAWRAIGLVTTNQLVLFGSMWSLNTRLLSTGNSLRLMAQPLRNSVLTSHANCMRSYAKPKQAKWASVPLTARTPGYIPRHARKKLPFELVYLWSYGGPIVLRHHTQTQTQTGTHTRTHRHRHKQTDRHTYIRLMDVWGRPSRPSIRDRMPYNTKQVIAGGKMLV